ncbi:hypothetical protein GF336_02380 [Candidatus Woesearchaeota archaeon]|nr:hypothetical protein [Candidatus Woesearchaeota archaeon]
MKPKLATLQQKLENIEPLTTKEINLFKNFAGRNKETINSAVQKYITKHSMDHSSLDSYSSAFKRYITKHYNDYAEKGKVTIHSSLGSEDCAEILEILKKY